MRRIIGWRLDFNTISLCLPHSFFFFFSPLVFVTFSQTGFQTIAINKTFSLLNGEHQVFTINLKCIPFLKYTPMHPQPPLGLRDENLIP